MRLSVICRVFVNRRNRRFLLSLFISAISWILNFSHNKRLLISYQTRLLNFCISSDKFLIFIHLLIFKLFFYFSFILFRLIIFPHSLVCILIYYWQFLKFSSGLIYLLLLLIIIYRLLINLFLFFYYSM